MVTKGARGRTNISGPRGREVIDGPRGRSVLEGGRGRTVASGPRGRITGGSADLGATGDEVQVVRDWFGDGVDGVLAYTSSTREWEIYSPQTGARDSFTWGQVGGTPVWGKFDGTRTQVASFLDGVWWIKDHDALTYSTVNYGIAGDVPISGFDGAGDGSDDVSVARPSWTWFWGASSQAWGIADDVLVGGPWNVAGTDVPAVYRGGTWMAYPLGTPRACGLVSDTPIPGDFNGNGLFQPCVFRPSTSTFYIMNDDDSITGFVYGTATCTPLVGKFTATDYDTVGYWEDGKLYFWRMAAPTVITTTLDAMTQDSAFSQVLAATGPAATWSVSAGTLPAGLTLSSSGTLSGTPTGSGAYDFTVTATNAGGSDAQQYTGTIAAAAPTVSNYFTGGVVTVTGGYRYHTFNTSGTLTFVDADGLGTAVDVDYLVVAGGGGGGTGGGGAGGLLSAASYSLSATQTITVGAGGVNSTTSGTNIGGKGNNSSLGAIAVAEGGGGGSRNALGDGMAGGSGGGAPASSAARLGGAGTVGQGNDGGDVNGTSFSGAAAGGGGKSAAAANVSASNIGTAGGAGAEWPSGSGTYYAGGGGGYGASTAGAGGVGGGGAGKTSTAADTAPGTANTGGGAGTVSVGGSGIVIVRYPDDPSMPPWSPLDLGPGLLGWWDPSDSGTVTMVSTKVSQIDDKSGNGNHLVQATDASRPTTGTINSLTSISVGASQVIQTSGTFSGAANLAIGGVWKFDTLVNFQGLVFAGQFRPGYPNTTNFQTFGGGGAALASSVARDTSRHVFISQRNTTTPASSYIGIDGAKTTGTLTAGPGTATIQFSSDGGFGSVTGQVGEVILYSGILSAAQEADLATYLADKWGITL